MPELTPTKRLFLIALVSISPFFALMFAAKSEPGPIASLSLVVNTLADVADANPGDTICDSDAGTSGSQCTLRAAIQEANAAAGDDTISFDASLSGAISLTSVLPDLTSNVTITGPGANTLTVQRSTAGPTPNFRIFNIPAGVTVSISGLTLSNGRVDNDGGGILNLGTLTIADSVLTSNSADSGGAIFTGIGSTLKISRTTISQNTTIGGTAAGILSQGTFTMTDSTVSDNTVSGGIFIGGGSAIIANSTISNNTEEGTGGGIFVTGDITVVTIVNTTITGNRADRTGTTGGVGGGLRSAAGNVHLRNTIVAGNFRGPGTFPDDISGDVNSSSANNLIGFGSGGLTSGINNNKVGVFSPGLGPLVNNGGPTQTHRLLPGSPAIDAGDSCVLNNSCSPSPGFSIANDQRGTGFARLFDGDFNNTASVDIGAYEAQEPTFIVTNSNDSGTGSLRNAIIDATQNGSGTITFQAGLTGTIALSTPLPDLTSMTIKGPGTSKLTVQRSVLNPFRIFTVTFGATVSISGLTISNGNAGGATVDSGAGGGIFNDGTLTIDECNITGNSSGGGGGVFNRGSLTILNSTIANNTTTGHGGGLENSSESTSLRIDRSTIASNHSNQTGGGIYHAGSSSTLITNTTISTNTAATGGGILNLNALVLSSVTITGNNASVRGGGIQTGGATVRFNNSIVAGNTSPLGPDCDGAGFVSDDYNLIGNTNGFQLNGVVTHNLNNVNPLLGPLANNGGPTQTHQLLAGSPALDAGSSTLLIDQRGRPRKVDQPNVPNAAGGDASDIGAYEAPIFEVNSTADTNDGACTLQGTGNGCTLREAINAANTAPGTQDITFAASLTSGGPTAITLLTALPLISSDLRITGPGAALMIVQRSSDVATPEFTIFSIGNGRTVSISDLTITNGKANGAGGGVNNQGTLTLTNCNIYGNSTTSVDGGGIQNTGTLLTLKNCNIGGLGPGQGNAGGGINNGPGTLVMTGGSIVGNTGVGIVISGTTTLDSVAITDNLGSGALIAATANISNCLIANNIANDDGGGIKNSVANTTIVNSTISGNTSTGSGGGIFNGNGFLTLLNVTITNNRADSDNLNSTGQTGGGVDARFGAVRLDNTIVTGNSRGSIQSAVADDIVSLNGVNAQSSFNIVGVCDNCGITNNFANNLTGVADAGLAPLADNGGPTFTHALLANSPALDGGSNSFITNPPFSGPPFGDQRGTDFSRIVDGPDGDLNARVDVGAFEQQIPITSIPNFNMREDSQLVIPFDVGDRGLITSITVTSANTTLVPNDMSHLRLTEAGTTELITINPAADRTGTVDILLTIIRTGGNQSRTITVTVDQVNDAPTFIRGVNQTVDEDCCFIVSIPNWATNISAGVDDESGQTLSFQVTGNTNPAMFMLAPNVSPAGTLTYLLAPNANGVAVITIVLKDNGGTANGGQDTSAAQTFSITVNAINDPPINTIMVVHSVVENGTLTFTTSNPISVGDFDSNTLQVSLITGQGLLTLSTTAGLSFTLGNGTSNNAMIFSGTIANLNAALNGMTFVPNQGFDGQATLQIVTSDGGNTGAGGPQTDTDFITINVLDGGTLQFQNSSALAAEGAGTATITVTRTTAFAGAASVNYSTSSGTAVGGTACVPGVDFINTSGTISFDENDATPKTFTVTLCNDTENEEDEVLNLTLSSPQGSGALGVPSSATLTLGNDDAPVLLTEENSEQAIALTSLFTTRDPFSLIDPFNLSNDHRRRVSLFVWRLDLQPTDNASNLTVIAEDSAGMDYPLTVEHAGAVPGLADDVSQVIVILPDNVIGAPRELWLTVKLRGPATNRASIRIAAP